MAYERQRREREQYLKDFSNDPFGKLKSGDHVGTAIVRQAVDELYDMTGAETEALYKLRQIVREFQSANAPLMQALNSLAGCNTMKDVAIQLSNYVADNYELYVLIVKILSARGLQGALGPEHLTHSAQEIITAKHRPREPEPQKQKQQPVQRSQPAGVSYTAK